MGSMKCYFWTWTAIKSGLAIGFWGQNLYRFEPCKYVCMDVCMYKLENSFVFGNIIYSCFTKFQFWFLPNWVQYILALCMGSICNGQQRVLHKLLLMRAAVFVLFIRILLLILCDVHGMPCHVFGVVSVDICAISSCLATFFFYFFFHLSIPDEYAWCYCSLFGFSC